MIQNYSDQETIEGKKKAILAYALGFFAAIPLLLTAGKNRYVKLILAYLLYGVITLATGRDFRMPLISGIIEQRLVR